MKALLNLLAFVALLLSGAVFGFFYAWVCSTMWGLDQTDPEVAIAAMQAMNASVRNTVFAPAFFGTPIVLLLTAFVAWKAARKPAALAFMGAAIVYLVGGFAVTASMNVPLNEGLAAVQLPLQPDLASATWSQYSDAWKYWNIVRTVATGLTLLLTGFGLTRLAK